MNSGNSHIPEILDNASELIELYGGSLSFSGINIHEIKLHRDGPSLLIRFDLPDFPKNPPVKWQGCNTIQLTLDLDSLRNFSITKFNTQNKCSLELSKSDSGIICECTGEAEFYAEVSFVTLTSMSGHLVTEGWGWP